MASLRKRPREAISIAVLYRADDTAAVRVVERVVRHFQGDPTSNLDRGIWITVVPIEASSPPEMSVLTSRINDPLALVVLSLLDGLRNPSSKWLQFWKELGDYLKARGRSARILQVDRKGRQKWKALEKLNTIRVDSLDEVAASAILTKCALTCAQAVRYYLKRADRGLKGLSDIQVDRQKDTIFISHSKHDPRRRGVRIAKKLRTAIIERHDVETFFDVASIRPGEDFEETILHEVAQSMLVVVHSDTYSSREWCRKELLTAKKCDRPAVVAGCVHDMDQRSFPYLGNTPYIGLGRLSAGRIDKLVLQIFTEMLRHYVWLARVSKSGSPGVYFISRAPELITLASTLSGVKPAENATVVYPDPPIGDEEKGLMEALRSDLVLLTFTEWQAARS